MKKILLAILAIAACTACNLGTLNYPESKDISVLRNVASRMAYASLSDPVQALNEIRTKKDIFAPGFEVRFEGKYQELKITLKSKQDSTWLFTTEKSYDNMVIEIYLRMLPSKDTTFRLWEAYGECDYVEESGYQAVLTFEKPVKYGWANRVVTVGSNYERFLTVNGEGSFITGDSDDNIIDSGVFIMKEQEVATPYNYYIDGELTLYK